MACLLDQSDTRVNAQCKPSLNDLRCKVWEVNTAPKIKIFMWKALSNALTVSEELLARGMKVDSRCLRCGEEGESINHVFFTCPVARLVWATSGFPFPPRGFEHRSLFENFSYLLACDKDLRIPKAVSGVFPWILWMLWKNRNAFAFEGRVFDAETTVAKCVEDSRRWVEMLEASKKDEEGRSRICNVGKVWKAPQRERERESNVILVFLGQKTLAWWELAGF